MREARALLASLGLNGLALNAAGLNTGARRFLGRGKARKYYFVWDFQPGLLAPLRARPPEA